MYCCVQQKWMSDRLYREKVNYAKMTYHRNNDC